MSCSVEILGITSDPKEDKPGSQDDPCPLQHLLRQICALQSQTANYMCISFCLAKFKQSIISLFVRLDRMTSRNRLPLDLLSQRCPIAGIYGPR